MSVWRQLARGVRVLVHRGDADRDADDEVRHYVDEAAAAYIAAGRTPDDARRAALLEIGNATVAREQIRAYGWENVVTSSLADLRYAARRLRHTPAFALVGMLTLALGIGASTAIFSAVNPVLFEPLPYPHADRIVTLWDFANDGGRLEVAFGTVREIVERSRSFERTAAMKPWQPTSVGAAQPERLEGQRVGAGYFHVLGVAPALGRDFEAADDVVNGPNVVILGDGLWRRRFDANPAIVGRQIALNDTGYTVIGVMPPGFENVLAPTAEIWAPLQYDVSLPINGREWGHHLRMAARLRPGVGLEQARREIDTITRTPLRDFPRASWAALGNGLVVSALRDDITRGVKPALVAVIGAVLLVLAIACVNVTNLLLARGAQRRGELAMRAALGAGRLRLVRQLLAESLLVALGGGALGLLVAAAGVRTLVAFSPPGLPRVDAIGIDVTIFLFALAVSTIVGLAVGIVPAIHASRHDLRAGLHDTARGSTAGHRITRRVLVVAEVALALVLLVCAGLLLRSLQRLFAVAPGFEAANLLTMQVQTAGRRFDNAGVTHRFFADALDAVRRVPGVIDAGFTSQLPLSGAADVYGVHFEASPTGNHQADRGAFRYSLTPGYLETMRIPIRRGRALDARDAAGAPGAVLISESLARSKFPNADALGQRLRIGPDDGPWSTVVGVVGNVRQTSLAVSQPDAVYVPNTQWTYTDRAMWLVARVHGDAAALAPAVRSAIWSVDADQPIVRVATMDRLVAASAAERRFALILFEAFAIAALALAAIGIYGILAGSVAERRREIGVRSALGASRGSILAMVMGQGMALVAAGTIVGLGGAVAASGALVTLLFGTSRLDVVTHVTVVALLAGVSAIACWLPAWRAARIDPSIALRTE